MKIVEKKISEIIPYGNNPRKNDEAVEYVARSIKEFGFKVPVVIDKENVIVAGHTRAKAAKQLGMETVPCIIANDLTEEQIRAFRLADNKTAEFSEWDINRLDIELNEIYDIDMERFGFKELDDMLTICDDEETAISIEHTVKIDKIKIAITQKEYDALIKRYNQYLDDNGVSFGFIGDILCSM